MKLPGRSPMHRHSKQQGNNALFLQQNTETKKQSTEQKKSSEGSSESWGSSSGSITSSSNEDKGSLHSDPGGSQSKVTVKILSQMQGETIKDSVSESSISEEEKKDQIRCDAFSFQERQKLQSQVLSSDKWPDFGSISVNEMVRNTSPENKQQPLKFENLFNKNSGSKEKKGSKIIASSQLQENIGKFQSFSQYHKGSQGGEIPEMTEAVETIQSEEDNDYNETEKTEKSEKKMQ